MQLHVFLICGDMHGLVIWVTNCECCNAQHCIFVVIVTIDKYPTVLSP